MVSDGVCASRFIYRKTTEKIKFFLPEYLYARSNKLLKKFFLGWSKISGCKAREILRNESYFTVRRNDEG